MRSLFYYQKKTMTKKEINEIRKIYHSTEWRKKRLEVLRNNKFECYDCKQKGRYTKATEVHHNIKIQDAPELAFEEFTQDKVTGEDIMQLVPLCKECHLRRHGYTFRRMKKKQLTKERW